MFAYSLSFSDLVNGLVALMNSNISSPVNLVRIFVFNVLFLQNLAKLLHLLLTCSCRIDPFYVVRREALPAVVKRDQ